MIASVTQPFCGSCDRVRLTADGQLRNCLFAARRDRPAGARCAAARTDDDLAAAIERGASAAKWAGPRDQPGALHPARRGR